MKKPPLPLPFEDLCKILDVSHETSAKLKRYGALLIKWQKAINLVADSTLNDLWRRHFLDSGQLFKLLPSPDTPLVDMGSGAGFPGMVLAMMGARHVTLIESDLKKVAFLREVARETETKVTFLPQRIETVTGLNPRPEIAMARALAPLSALIGWQKHLGAPQGLYLKGARAGHEIAEASLLHDFTDTQIISQSEPEARIVQISLVSHETGNTG